MKNELGVIVLFGTFVNLIIAGCVVVAYGIGLFTGILETVALIYSVASVVWAVGFFVFGGIVCSAIEAKRGIKA